MVLTVETGKKRMPNRDKSFKLLLSCAASLLSYAFWMWKDCFSKGQRSGMRSEVWKQMHQLDDVLYPALGAQRPQPD